MYSADCDASDVYCPAVASGLPSSQPEACTAPNNGQGCAAGELRVACTNKENTTCLSVQDSASQCTGYIQGDGTDTYCPSDVTRGDPTGLTSTAPLECKAKICPEGTVRVACTATEDTKCVEELNGVQCSDETKYCAGASLGYASTTIEDCGTIACLAGETRIGCNNDSKSSATCIDNADCDDADKYCPANTSAGSTTTSTTDCSLFQCTAGQHRLACTSETDTECVTTDCDSHQYYCPGNSNANYIAKR